MGSSESKTIERLAEVMRGCRPGMGGAARKSFAEALDSSGLPADARNRLESLLSLAETWIRDDKAVPTESLATLLTISDPPTPPLVVAASLKHFPSAAAVDWSALLDRQPAAVIVEALLREKLLKPKALLAFVERCGTRAWDTAALDVIVKRRLKLPRAILAQPPATRPAHLLPVGYVIAASYAADKAASADHWLVSVLSTHEQLRRAVLRAVLEHPNGASRLARHLFLERASGEDAKRRAIAAEHWIQVCDEVMSSHAADAQMAGVVVGLARLVRSIPSMGHSGDLPGAGGTRSVALAYLAAGERGGRSKEEALAVVLDAADLPALFAEFIEKLTIAANDEGSPEQRLALERFRTKKALVLALIAVLEADNTACRDAVSAVLVNANVTPLGEVGQTVAFDVRRHETSATGLETGQPARVMKPGWQFSEGEQHFVLMKALVGTA